MDTADTVHTVDIVYIVRTLDIVHSVHNVNNVDAAAGGLYVTDIVDMVGTVDSGQLAQVNAIRLGKHFYCLITSILAFLSVVLLPRSLDEPDVPTLAIVGIPIFTKWDTQCQCRVKVFSPYPWIGVLVISVVLRSFLLLPTSS